MKQGTSVVNLTLPLGSFVESQTGPGWEQQSMGGRDRRRFQATSALEPGPCLTQDTVADSFCPTSPSGLQGALELGRPVDREKLGFLPAARRLGGPLGHPSLSLLYVALSDAGGNERIQMSAR